MKLMAIRGAVCAENTKESISKQTADMCNKIFTENNIKAENIVSMQFTLTKDLDQMNPCSALRHEKIVIKTSEIPLFCSQEAYIQGGLEKVVRVLLTAYVEDNQKPVHIYLNGAEKLRPDFKR